MTDNKFSAFKISEFAPAAGTTLDNVIALAQHAEHAERYEDMCEIMKLRVTEFSDKKLDTTERNLLSVAYKNVIGARRASWRTISSELEKCEGEHKDNLTAYKTVIENELEGISKDVLNLLTDNLIMTPSWDKEHSSPAKDDIKAQDEVHAQVFYLKMAGDYYRYLNESLNKEEDKIQTSNHYKRAMEIATLALAPTHPIRLGLALNYSVCFYEILKEPQQACDLAKNAFDEAISKLDQLEETDYKDSTLIMQLLRDNLTLWTTNEPTDSDLAVEDFEGEIN